MNAAELLISLAAKHGFEVMFANPGTTEMPLVAALSSTPAMRAVLGLHENVCSGAADGYGRVLGKPALTLLHLGPGFANAMANLHNARRARSPIINIIGDHATWHLDADPPLAMDIASAAKPVSAHLAVIETPDGTADALATALEVAGEGQIATLLFPHDHQLAIVSAPAEGPQTQAQPPNRPVPASSLIEQACRLLQGAGRKALFVGGAALHGDTLLKLGSVALATGTELISETSFAKLECGQGLPHVQRLPYFPEQAQTLLDRFETVVICGAKSPVSFFGYGDKPSQFLKGRDGVFTLAGPLDDIDAAVSGLADALVMEQPQAGAMQAAWQRALPETDLGDGLTPDSLAQTLIRSQPEGAIVIPTAVSSAAAYSAIAHLAPAHSELVLTGGAIGSGPAMAVGAAIAAPDRQVINLEADGSMAYLPQALWTQARERLNVLTIVCANHRYNILQLEMNRAGFNSIEGAVRDLTALDEPRIDWVSLANGYGVQAQRAFDVASFDQALRTGLDYDGPYLIEAELP